MISKFLILITIPLILFACSETEKNNTNSLNKSDIKELEEIQNNENSQTEDINDKHPLIIKFSEFELTINDLEIWDEQKQLKAIQNDTATVYLEVGETIQGKKIKLNQNKEGTIKIYQRFENSISIMNEGPHCDLTEWKHFNSEWKNLTIKEGMFLTKSYTKSEKEKFIEIEITELENAVKKQCGEDWAKLIKDIKSPTEYPSGISTSRIFLKIEFTAKENNIPIEQIISFEIPMGC